MRGIVSRANPGDATLLASLDGEHCYLTAVELGILPILSALFAEDAQTVQESWDDETNPEPPSVLLVDWLSGPFRGDRRNGTGTFGKMDKKRFCEYLDSDPAAWRNCFDDCCAVAATITSPGGMYAHRNARDVFSSLQLLWVHESVAESVMKRDHDYMVPKVAQLMKETAGRAHVDTNNVIQQNAFQLGALVAIWAERFERPVKKGAYGLKGRDLHIYQDLVMPMALKWLGTKGDGEAERRYGNGANVEGGR
jgi:hypothetical protein